MDATWAALLDASIALAALAGIEPEPVQPEERYFPAMIRAIGGWRAEMAESNIADLAAIMEPGLAALLTAKARGAKTGPAAQSLWQEFQEARAALLALIPNNDVAGKRQSA
ncbi:hypothetical protein MB02_08990 [Croceicoccus estronivorus]|uniref:hypothetical protein n=1 Tax=Croceicoccus estronivorus TaxID=1172626 RepID=UPI00082FE2DD|nr:hypothetical protein [Croceicoccus estronivorus]OCC24123.1 hypothetical protein MB02_08990 [Croceicoccus estronivorus]